MLLIWRSSGIWMKRSHCIIESVWVKTNGCLWANMLHWTTLSSKSTCLLIYWSVTHIRSLTLLYLQGHFIGVHEFIWKFTPLFRLTPNLFVHIKSSAAARPWIFDVPLSITSFSILLNGPSCVECAGSVLYYNFCTFSHSLVAAHKCHFLLCYRFRLKYRNTLNILTRQIYKQYVLKKLTFISFKPNIWLMLKWENNIKDL